MTWIDNNGEVRPSSWEEYCQMVRLAPDWPTTQWLMRNRRRLLHGKPQPNVFDRQAPQEFTVTHKEPRPRRATDRERLQRMRIRLFNADPHCFWCGVEVHLVGGLLATFATIDHLYSRWHPERKARHVEGRGVLHVLACHDCNQERAGAEVQMIPFVPKLRERLEFAQRADATLAKREIKPIPAAESAPMQRQLLARPMRVIQTLKEAAEFSQENPAR